MAVYVSLAQIPVALRFEEPYEQVVERFRSLIENGEVVRFDHGDGTAVLVNFAVQASAVVTEGHSVLTPSDIHRAVTASLPVGDD